MKKTDASLNNRSLTLRLLFSHGTLSRTDIASYLNITTAAVTAIVSHFLDEGLLFQQDADQENQGRVGRRRLPISINYNWKYILAVDIHSYYINIAVTNLKGEVQTERTLTPAGNTPKAFCSDIAKECIKMLWETSIPVDKILGAGITVIGPVNQEDGIALHLFRLFDDPFPIRQYFEEEFPFPVAVENNVCAFLLSELCYTDIASEAQNILMLRWGPGVGSALAIHSQIYKGYNYQSPEIGHNLIREEGGKKCNCGMTGCLEPTVSTDAIVEFIHDQIIAEPSGELAELAAKLGAPSRKNLSLYLETSSEILWNFVKECAHALASVTVNAIHILAPAKLIFVGDLFEIDAIVKLFEEQLYSINPHLPKNLCMKAKIAANQKFIGTTAVAIEQLLLTR